MLSEAAARQALARREGQAGPSLSPKRIGAMSAVYLSAHRRGPLSISASLESESPFEPSGPRGESVDVTLADEKGKSTCRSSLWFY